MSNALARQATALVDSGDPDGAWSIAERLMETALHRGGVPEANPLVLASYILWKAQSKIAVALYLAKYATILTPDEPAAWINYANAAQELYELDAADAAYKRALSLIEKSDTHQHYRPIVLVSLSANYISGGQFDKAEYTARQALELAPDSVKAKANIGFGMLGQRKWEGWDWYSHCMGLQQRPQVKFNGEPDWNGTTGKTVAFYGEQGLGDELSFASMLPDAIRDCAKVIVECDPKLTGLFRRSFPSARVYGTRKAKAGDGAKWDEADWKMDASLALGELGKFYRRTDDSFPGDPYLQADPDRRLMWRSLLATKGKPSIGIAWTGGIKQTGARFRALTLEQLKPILLSVNAHWVSLQYKDAAKEIAMLAKSAPQIDIAQYPYATLTPDYDDTAALVAELDLVICMQTAVAHLAGALGKECWVLLPRASQWRYGMEGDTMPWYRSLRVFRQRGEAWTGPLGNIVGALRARYRVLEAA